jgi:hypothetical protein
MKNVQTNNKLLTVLLYTVLLLNVIARRSGTYYVYYGGYKKLSVYFCVSTVKTKMSIYEACTTKNVAFCAILG